MLPTETQYVFLRQMQFTSTWGFQMLVNRECLLSKYGIAEVTWLAQVHSAGSSGIIFCLPIRKTDMSSLSYSTVPQKTLCSLR